MTIKIEVTHEEKRMILHALMGYNGCLDRLAFRLLAGKITGFRPKDPADDGPEVEILRSNLWFCNYCDFSGATSEVNRHLFMKHADLCDARKR